MSSVRPTTHGLRSMSGRDPRDGHRAATPLELLYDLVFVISFGVAGSEFAHLLAEGHYRAGLIGFSTTTSTSDSAAMMRLRSGNRHASGGVPGANSEMSSPSDATHAHSSV